MSFFEKLIEHTDEDIVSKEQDKDEKPKKINDQKSDNKKESWKDRIVDYLKDFCVYWWGSQCNFDKICKDDSFFNYFSKIFASIRDMNKNLLEKNYEIPLKLSVLPLLYLINDHFGILQKNFEPILSSDHYEFAFSFFKTYLNSKDVPETSNYNTIMDFIKKEHIVHFNKKNMIEMDGKQMDPKKVIESLKKEIHSLKKKNLIYSHLIAFSSFYEQ
mmetsp:Transcript_11692/g.17348  ORF Transcript_11692/g.17348 Transcript_11692/m.17348 type:complete len:216 (+) Transcript_11692:468-1115(+)